MTQPAAPWQLLVAQPSVLGESPFWHPQELSLYWVDIAARAVLRYLLSWIWFLPALAWSYAFGVRSGAGVAGMAVAVPWPLTVESLVDELDRPVTPNQQVMTDNDSLEPRLRPGLSFFGVCSSA